MAVASRPSAVVPAPGRGQYDRALTRAERQAEQRERLIRAAAEAYCTGPLTVARVVALAAVGRNTFYEYFDDPEHALALAQGKALRALEARMREASEEARTPLEMLRALSRAWFATQDADPVAFRVALRPPEPQRPGALSPAGQLFCDTLARSIEHARQSAGLGKPPAFARVVAVAAAAEVFSRARFSDESSPAKESELADVTIALLR